MKNWAGNITYATEDVRYPRDVETLQQAVASARSVRALGSGHSFSSVGDTTGVLVSTRDLTFPVEIDADARVAVVPGGATYAVVSRALHASGWALHNLGSLPHISVAGACSTGTHGSGHLNGCLASAVVGIELVRADGELVTVRAGDPDFQGAVLALGALGVATRVWLRIEPTYDVRQGVALDVPYGAVADQAERILTSAYSVSLFTTFGQPGLVDTVWVKQRVAPDAPDIDADDESSWPGVSWGGRLATEAVHPIPGLDAVAATEQLNVRGAWHDRLPHFRMEFVPSSGDELQSEYFIAREHASAVLEALEAAAPSFTSVLQVCEIRTIAGDDLWLSPFNGRDTVAVHATWGPDIDVVRPGLAAMEAALAPFDPRPHWGKVFLDFDADRIEGCFPGLLKFRELADRFDPERCFANDYLVGLGVR